MQGLKLYQEHFANARELIITVRAPDSERAERLAGALAARLRQETNLIAGVSWQAPWMEHPEQAAEIVACLWFNQPPRILWHADQPARPDHLQSVLAETGRARHVALADGHRPARVRSPTTCSACPRWPISAGFPRNKDNGRLPRRTEPSG